jgi:protein-disulfide isomerase
MSASDPRKPLVFGIIGLAALMLGGIIWAVVFLPTAAPGATYDANASFDDSNDPAFGPADAKATIRIFEDFQCPACRLASEGIKHVRETYADSVRIVWNDFPLEAHANARIAANAARCAEEQGKFWEYGDALYASQETWTPIQDPSEMFTSIATQIGLAGDPFVQCLSERRYDEKIAADVKEGIANRVDVTPTFFLNNNRYTGALTAEQWDEKLKSVLK